jgi:hypothetical protein
LTAEAGLNPAATDLLLLCSNNYIKAVVKDAVRQ